MTRTHKLHEEILKACDIRGIVDKELDSTDAYYIGRSFGTILVRAKKTNCVTGYDGRHSSPALSAQLIRGLRESGVSVTDIGLVPTPALYHAVPRLEADAGVMVTASHNPSEYNGFKFFTAEGPFHGGSISAFSALCERGDFAHGEGSLQHFDIIPEYLAYLQKQLTTPFERELSIVWDPGNGAAAVLLDRFLKGIPGRHRIICGEVDGDFPHHHPDPSLPENMIMLQDAVKESKADLGIAFDGDGDRMGIVDSEGYIFLGDQLLVLFARDLLRTAPGSVIMSEVKASRFFYDDVAGNGGNPLMWRVGHTNQKEKMIEDGIPLAGETSGHIFFADNNNYDDGLYSAVRLINILGHSEETITEMRKRFPVFHDSGEIRLVLDSSGRDRLIREISGRLRREGRSFVDIDGIRTVCGDGFWMMRGSNTQPHITIRCEAATKAGLEECMRDLRQQLLLSGIRLNS